MDINIHISDEDKDPEIVIFKRRMYISLPASIIDSSFIMATHEFKNGY